MWKGCQRFSYLSSYHLPLFRFCFSAAICGLAFSVEDWGWWRFFCQICNTSSFSLLSSLVWMLENLCFVHVLCVFQYVGEWGDGFWSQSSVVNFVPCPRIVIVWNIKIQVSLFPALAISFWCFDCRKRIVFFFFTIDVKVRVNFYAFRIITRS